MAAYQQKLQQAAMIQQQAMLSSFPLKHDDYVLDLAFDFYGKRIATCSADQKIRVWEKKSRLIPLSNSGNFSETNEATGQIVEWELVDELSKSHGHQAAVQRVQWADPEFGSVIASSSFDKQVIIWEEMETKDKDKKQWQRKHMFMEKEAINDIKFAPRHWGLIIVIAVADGTINMHLATDLNNLS